MDNYQFLHVPLPGGLKLASCNTTKFKHLSFFVGSKAIQPNDGQRQMKTLADKLVMENEALMANIIQMTTRARVIGASRSNCMSNAILEKLREKMCVKVRM